MYLFIFWTALEEIMSKNAYIYPSQGHIYANVTLYNTSKSGK